MSTKIRYILLSKRQVSRLKHKAIAAADLDQHEVCGLIYMNNRKFTRLLFLPNEKLTSLSYNISAGMVNEHCRRLSRKSYNVIGSFHSHPISEAIPSDADIKRGFFRGIELIFDVCARKCRAWRIVNRRQSKIKEISIYNTAAALKVQQLVLDSKVAT